MATRGRHRKALWGRTRGEEHDADPGGAPHAIRAKAHGFGTGQRLCARRPVGPAAERMLRSVAPPIEALDCNAETLQWLAVLAVSGALSIGFIRGFRRFVCGLRLGGRDLLEDSI